MISKNTNEIYIQRTDNLDDQVIPKQWQSTQATVVTKESENQSKHTSSLWTENNKKIN